MFNSLKMAILALAGVASTQQATPPPQTVETPKTTVATAPQVNITRQNSRSISLTFSGTISDLCTQLGAQRVNFVVSDEAVGSKKIHLNIVDRPIDEAMEAIAMALGGACVRRGETYVFTNATAFALPSLAPQPREGLFIPDMFPPAKTLPPMVWDLSAPGLSKEQRAQIEKMLKDLKGSGLSKEEMADLEKAMRDMKGQMKDFTFAMPAEVKGFALDPKAAKEMELQARKLQADAKSFALAVPGRPAKVLGDPKANKELELQIRNSKDLALDAQKAKVLELRGRALAEASQNAKTFELRAKALADAGPKVWIGDREGNGFFGIKNLGAFIKTVNDDQWKKQRSQGYLKWSDLTDAQRKVLGDRPAGSFQVTFSQDGKTITIKN